MKKDIRMSVKYLSSEGKEQGMASLRVSSSLYARGHTAFRHQLRYIIPERILAKEKISLNRKVMASIERLD
jgi:hypothetical protein